MSVFKRFNGKRLKSAKDPNYAKARWWIYKKIKGQKTIHHSLPEARTREEAELAERQLVKAIFDRVYGVSDTTTTFEGFVESKYRKYVEQNNVNKKAKDLYIRLLVGQFKQRPLGSITAQDCRDCRQKLQAVVNKERGTTLSNSSINRIMSTASKIFSLACEEGILERNPMQHVKYLPEPPARRRLLTEEQKEALWKELEKDSLMFRLITLASHTPLRKAQLLALTPDAVDLENGLLFVIASKGRLPRAVPLNSTATHILTLMIVDGQLPFPLKDFRKRWHPMLIRAGINKPGGTREQNYHFHDLRTLFSGDLIRNNVNPLTIQKLFGHSSMAITNIYSDPDAALMLDAVRRLDEVQQSEVIQ